MMTIDAIKAAIPDYAKDIRINIGRILTEDNAKGLTQKQIYGTALASAFATSNQAVIRQLLELSQPELEDADIQGIKSAVSIMAMNNIYYRTIGMMSDSIFSQLQPGLRMQVIGNPGIPKVDFEIYSLAVSAINGCQHCVDSHSTVLMQSGINQEGVQSVIRISAVVYALHQINAIED